MASTPCVVQGLPSCDSRPPASERRWRAVPAVECCKAGGVYRGIVGTKNVRAELEEWRRMFDLLESISPNQCMVYMGGKMVISQCCDNETLTPIVRCMMLRQ